MGQGAGGAGAGQGGYLLTVDALQPAQGHPQAEDLHLPRAASGSVLVPIPATAVSPPPGIPTQPGSGRPVPLTSPLVLLLLGTPTTYSVGDESSEFPRHGTGVGMGAWGYPWHWGGHGDIGIPLALGWAWGCRDTPGTEAGMGARGYPWHWGGLRGPPWHRGGHGGTEMSGLLSWHNSCPRAIGRGGHPGAQGCPGPVSPPAGGPGPRARPAIPLVWGLPSNSPTATEYPAGRQALLTPAMPRHELAMGPGCPTPVAHPGTRPHRPWTAPPWAALGSPATAGTCRGSG